MRVEIFVSMLLIAFSLSCAPVPTEENLETDTESVNVPLKLVPIGNGEFKVGISVGLGGGSTKLYTFDTGSSGFYAAYDAQWWPNFTPVSATVYDQSYGDGVVFESQVVKTDISIPTSDGPAIQANLDVRQITDAYGGTLGAKGSSTWKTDLDAGKPPLFGNFFGDFGSGLRKVGGIFAVLPQLPGNLSSGFAVQLGCRDSTQALLPTQKLVIGLTSQMRLKAVSWVPMQGVNQNDPFPNGTPTYAQALIATDFALSNASLATYSFSTHSILDTGAPTTSIHAGSDIAIPTAYLKSPTLMRTQILSGKSWNVSAPGTQTNNGFTLSLTTGEKAGENKIDVKIETGSTHSEVNLGLIPFFRHDVIFDVQNGLVGFAPSCSL